MTAAAEITSFGYGHGLAPQAHITLDLRPFRDPHVNPAFRQLTAEDPRVVATVLATPGIGQLIDAASFAVTAYPVFPDGGPVKVAVGCVGGRHRAPTVAAELAARLRQYGAPVTLTHRDMHRPVIDRPVTAGAS